MMLRHLSLGSIENFVQQHLHLADAQRLLAALISQQRGFAAATDAVASTSGRVDTAPSSSVISATCILERLPVVMPDAPTWEAEHHAWYVKRQVRQNELKIYADPNDSTDSRKQKSKSDLRGMDAARFTPVPRQTKADMEGNKRTMKRALDQRLYFLVKQSIQGKDRWGFPSAAWQEGESIRETAERALYTTLGKAFPVLFIGNSPMGHIRLSQSDTTFFMLAQAVDDPWDVKLPAESPAKDFLWVTKQELPEYVEAARVQDILQRML